MFISLVKAEDKCDYTVVKSSDSEYSFQIKRVRNFKYNTDNIFYVGQKLSEINIEGDLYYNGKITFKRQHWIDKDYTLKSGYQEIDLIVYDIFNYYYEKPITFTIGLTPVEKETKGNQNLENVNIEEQSIEETSALPSLTATKIILAEKGMSYDININDKIAGSSYKWTSSNKKVAKVNSKGLVTAVNKGKATITCEITFPNNIKHTLKANVIVGSDENTPILSKNELELDVGEKFTIKVENLIKGSKISWKSNNKKIAKVGSANGKVTAISEGKTYLICTVTTPDNEVIILKCNVTVTN